MKINIQKITDSLNLYTVFVKPEGKELIVLGYAEISFNDFSKHFNYFFIRSGSVFSAKFNKESDFSDHLKNLAVSTLTPEFEIYYVR